MLKPQRLFGLLGMCGAAGVAALAGPAWACSQSPIIKTATATVLPGSDLVVNGENWDAPSTSGPVELRWNSKVGAPLTSAAGMSFSVQFPIPAEASGRYVINAEQRSLADNSVRWNRSVTINVIAPAATVPAVDEVTTPVTEPVTEPVVGPVTPEGPPVEVVQPVPDDVVGPVVANPTAPNPVPSGSTGSGPQSPASSDEPASPPAGRGGSMAERGPGAGSPRSLPGISGGAAVVVPGGLVGSHSAGRRIGVDERDPVPAEPALAWVQPADARPAPSLFEPVDSLDSHRRSTAPVGAAMVGLGLMAIVGIGLVAGQGRLALVRSGSTAR